jgi:plasmid stabilization system protein ParE
VRVRYTLPALADLDAIFAYVATYSRQGSGRIQYRIKAAIDRLLAQPHLGVCTEDPTIRRLTIAPYPYLIFYEISESEIIIHAIRHGARDPRSMPGALNEGD